MTDAAGNQRSWRVALTRLLNDGRDLLFPPQCVVCRQPYEAQKQNANERICRFCLTNLQPREPYLCRRCGAERPVAPFYHDDPCADCRDEEFRFGPVYSLGNYERLLRDVVLRCKYPHEEPLIRELGRMLIDRHGDEWRAARFDAVVSIPMYWWRKMRRGINGPEILADELAEQLNISRVKRGLKRVHSTRPQGELSRTARQRNLRDAMALTTGICWTGKRVLLVDDIVTTGVTCNAATRLLTAAGATSVAVAILARARHHG